MTKKEAIKYLIAPTATSTNPSEAYLKQKEAYELAIKALEERPTDEPVGTWIEENVEPDIVLSPHGHRWRCPICTHWQAYGNPKYCPDCGARLNKCQEVIERKKKLDEELRRKREQI